MIAWINLERERKETSSISFSIIFFHTDCNALPSVSPVCTVCSLLLLVYAVPCWDRKLAIDGKHTPAASVNVPWSFVRYVEVGGGGGGGIHGAPFWPSPT